ncbi:hypothetical protein L0244_13535 [bacterium]|nr:hypothetical protein [bacterium]
MAAILTADFFEDEIAFSLALAITVANKRARELGIDVLQSLITVTQSSFKGGLFWRINYGPRDYIGRRGGDLIIEVDSDDARINQVLWGQ